MVGLLDRVVATIAKYKLLCDGDKVLVAVSGGADSMFLLWVLDRIASCKPGDGGCKLELRVAHLNHCLRDRACEEADFVRMESDKLGIPCSIEEVDVRSYCRENKVGLEEGARELRYEFLYREADKFGMNKIAMGHTADDQLETFILRVGRGCGGRGILSIPPKREQKAKIEIIRPLIEVGREEIREYLNKENIDYRVDESNYDCSNVRNFVRHYVVPRLKEVAHDFSSKVNRLRDILDEEEEFLDKLTENRLKEIIDRNNKKKEGIILNLDGFLETPLAIKRRILRNVKISNAHWYPSYDEIENAIRYIENSRGGKEFDFCGIKIVKSCGKLLITGYKIPRAEDYEIELSVPGQVQVSGYKIKSKMRNQKLKLNYDESQRVYFDLVKLTLPLMIRSMKLGDRIRLQIGEKKLTDVFIDAKIPVWDRRNIPLLVDGSGILWIVGNRRAHRALVEKETNKVVEVWIES